MGQSAKVKKTISLSADTAERLKAYAKVRHTSVSQLITDWIWQVDVPSGHDGPPKGWPKTFGRKE